MHHPSRRTFSNPSYNLLISERGRNKLTKPSSSSKEWIKWCILQEKLQFNLISWLKVFIRCFLMELIYTHENLHHSTCELKKHILRLISLAISMAPQHGPPAFLKKLEIPFSSREWSSNVTISSCLHYQCHSYNSKVSNHQSASNDKSHSPQHFTTSNQIQRSLPPIEIGDMLTKKSIFWVRILVSNF